MRLSNKIILLFGLLLAGLFVFGCESGAKPLILSEEGDLPLSLCEERGLDGKIMVLESKYCGACKAAKPLVQAAAGEVGVEVLFLDLAEGKDAREAEKLGLVPQYTPTLLVGCQVYIGVKSKEEYVSFFEGFLAK